MVHSLTQSLRSGTRDRPSTRDQPIAEHSLVIPSRTSSLHSRITQPIPSVLNSKTQQRLPKTLTYAYVVSGVGREPSQWVKAPPPTQGKITHVKGAVGQFYLPEILGSSPRLDSDSEIARVLHGAMRVSVAVISRLNVADRSSGLLPTRCRNLHRPDTTALHPPHLCPSAGLLSDPLWYCS